MGTNDDPSAGVVTQLRRERDQIRAHIEEAERDLVASNDRLSKVDVAIEALIRYYGLEAEPDDATDADLSSALPDDQVHASSPEPEAVEGESAKRIASTALVAQIVEESDEPLTRRDILREFERRGLIPKGWSNPANNVGTAVARAARQGTIVQVDSKRFAKPPTDASLTPGASLNAEPSTSEVTLP